MSSIPLTNPSVMTVYRTGTLLPPRSCASQQHRSTSHAGIGLGILPYMICVRICRGQARGLSALCNLWRRSSHLASLLLVSASFKSNSSLYLSPLHSSPIPDGRTPGNPQRTPDCLRAWTLWERSTSSDMLFSTSCRQRGRSST